MAGRRVQPTVPFAKNRERHGRNRGAAGATDRAFCKKTSKARSKPRYSRRNRPCLLQKIIKGTVEKRAQTVQPTVPFAKNHQRHGRNRGVAGVDDRAFCKKTSKARSKSQSSGRNRPCLLQKIIKGTVETAGQRAQPTVPFAKKTPKARSKSRGGRHNRPCLLQKSGKGTVEIAGRSAQPTVPFAKKRQRHGRNRGAVGATDRAFCKKTTKARSKWRHGRRNRPCLLQKIIKGTVETAGQRAQPTVPFAKNHQRHGRNRRAVGAIDRAFCKKMPKARSKPQGSGRNRPCLLQKIVKGTVENAE